MDGNSGQRPMTGYDRRMYAIMNRREGAPLYATGPRRRAVVVAHMVLTALGIACWLYSVFGDQRWATYGMLGILLPWCLATGVINGATRGLLELRARALDERQRAEKNRVQARAQHLMMWLLFAVTVAVGAGGLMGLEAEGLVFPVLFSVFVVHWLMPLWLAGLQAQDEPEYDDEPVGAV
ncbi:hypothetical protein [Streptomyces luteocolor]|uniref:hypothetical protein n=1 Tax=Streptomyces luteocolor TaxID=285500 RepID=UPI000852BB5B|nr:hypothetical protein [Streptomyces luteocolor]